MWFLVYSLKPNALDLEVRSQRKPCCAQTPRRLLFCRRENEFLSKEPLQRGGGRGEVGSTSGGGGRRGGGGGGYSRSTRR